MQIKLATARGLGYTGDAAGLRDPNTNPYLRGEISRRRLPRCNGDHKRAMALLCQRVLCRRKTPRLERIGHSEPVLSSAPPMAALKNAADANALQVPGR